MTTTITSRDPPPANLEAVLRRICVDTSLKRWQRYDISSALRTFSKEIGRPLAELPAHPLTLRQRPAGLMPNLGNLDVEALERFKLHWANTVSRIRFGFEHLGIIPVTNRCCATIKVRIPDNQDENL